MTATDSKKLWWMLGALLCVSFSVLLWMGSEIYRQAPPIPEAFVSDTGELLYTRDDIQTGREVWQSMGGMQLGSIWGHGAYVAPDWSADWLHRESQALLDSMAHDRFGVPLSELGSVDRAALEQALREQIRINTYDPDSERVTLSSARVAAARQAAEHYQALFGRDPAFR
ncbi:MAG: nitric-oxide reductase large subunit, partial [Xanthomonadales bacterium]|nr:nitric-oxide reductase large subunit [Xanthomonadales bacterium]